MKTIKPSATYFGVYSPLFRVQVHQLIAWGYEDARHGIRSNNEHEPAITGFIAEAIQERFWALNCPKWCTHYSVHDNPPVRREGRSGSSRLKPDIIIEANFLGRPEYVFEAKRLRKIGYGVGKYVDSDGMGRFISGLYASRYDEAAMLGYVQSDSLVHWQGKVRKAIDDNVNQLRLRPPQRNERVIDAFPLEWVSEHERDSIGRPITIYHILLDCRS